MLELSNLCTGSCQSTFTKEVMLDYSYQDPNEFWTEYGLDYCFNNFGLVVTDIEILIYKNNDIE